MAHRSTIQDLAEAAGVSVSTIDRILNGRAKVRGATAEKVLASAEALGFYALPALRERLGQKPTLRLGFLLQQSQRSFYRLIAEALRKATPPEVEVVIEFMEDLSPEAVADHALRLGRQVRALALVSAEHARVSHALETLAAEGVPAYALISELTAGCGVGYIGLDNWKAGRTAGWAITGLTRKPGKVAILVGNHRYRCQEWNEIGFRSYCREHAPDFTLLEPLQTFESAAIARDVAHQLLAREPELSGLYVSGGGMPGVLEALRETGRGKGLITVGNDLTEHTRLGLIDGVMSLVVAHPLARLATEAFAQMLGDLHSGTSPGKRLISFDIYTPESI
ncbi:MAG: LacI family DNA-binding transcriptional regulator [Gemmobacter sp.]|uniref:LacI family DNA-binding transcriptional regulator n=1 Tax=Gemmobacter sp. TaxID=1898957 RepID=UPI001A5D2C78|nr:LacI family DNA-binding transcriptional regulator [Gemmobacter sp.]MBL8563232.1 LacI family DNA-binding transcriptional regulator [Gemmobacter sp.]